VGIQKIFALEGDIRVIARADTLAGLHHAGPTLSTDGILLEAKLIAGTVDAVPGLVRSAPKVKIIVSRPRTRKSIQLNSTAGVFKHHPPLHLAQPTCQVRPHDHRRGNVDRQPVRQLGNRGLPLEGFWADRPAGGPLTEGVSEHHLHHVGHAQLAHELGTKEQVIRNFLNKVYDKLGVSDRLELVHVCRVLIVATSLASRDFRRKRPRRTGLRLTTRAEATFALKYLLGGVREEPYPLARMLFGAFKLLGFLQFRKRGPVQVTGIGFPLCNCSGLL
jgi:hypothetical protein